MEQPQIKGWCPTGWRPMASGDGWIMRLQLSAYTSTQLLHVCAVAEQCGSGVIELTNRGNVQLRGLPEHAIPAAQSALHKLGCLPPAEAPLPIMLNPDWEPGDLTHQLAQTWQSRPSMPLSLPAKFSIVFDAGAQPILSDVRADIRVECSASGTLLVRLDGQHLGARCTSVHAAIEHIEALMAWFAAHRSETVQRLRHIAAPPRWHQPDTPPAAVRPPLQPGSTPQGCVLGVPFGQMLASTLKNALSAGPASSVRVTPWRSLLLNDWQQWPEFDAKPWIRSANDPRSRIIACPGAPHCSQATVATRDLALALAPWVNGTLHVSGCAKRCASRSSTDIELIGRNGRYDLTQPNCQPAQPSTGLTAEDALTQLRRH